MRKLLAIAALFLSGCAVNPPAEAPDWIGKYKNACLPEAIAMTQGLKAIGIDAKVLTLYTDNWGHAVCVYMYPPGKNQMWAWDSYWKSLRMRAWSNDPRSIARAWMTAVGKKDSLTNALFIE
jgi:hypothetical protein